MEIILHSMSQTRKKKWDSLAFSRGNSWMMRRCHNIPCFYFHFLFRNNSIKEQLDESNFRRSYGICFLESAIPMALDHIYVLISFSTITRHLTTAFERHLTTEDFTDVDRHRCQACTKTFNLLFYASLSLEQT